jgi:hypothetical protein
MHVAVGLYNSDNDESGKKHPIKSRTETVTVVWTREKNGE